jgi:eukaryotic-like serine/threonine-protein kinase
MESGATARTCATLLDHSESLTHLVRILLAEIGQCRPHSRMNLKPGDLLGPYRIEALLGMGGMGEVYRARDVRLGRDAALKVIAPKLLGEASLRRRFETEARAASALNHPSIVTIYDVGESAGVSWIAMEWVEGRTLRQMLSEAPMSLGRVVSIARQLAEGLAAAHAKGVVHRDLKPDNIMIVEDGRAKILDFGLARQTVAQATESSASKAETFPALAGEATIEGAILGTVGYMSPEQASGRAVDFRSDQFAFGVLLYEMLAGRRAFARSSSIETLAAIMRDDPVPLTSIRAGIPESLQNLIAQCLAKVPEGRFASTREIAMALEGIAAGVSQVRVSSDEATATVVRDAGPVVPESKGRAGRRTAVSIAAALALTLGVFAWTRFQDAPSSIESLAVLPFENATKDPNADYLGEGLTESLIDQMSRVSSLKVMARSTVARFKRTTDPQSVGRQLGVGAVLVGAISKRDGQLIIGVELVESSTGARLWGHTFDRPETNLLRVQDSIAVEIVDSMRLQLSPEQKQRFVKHGTDNPEAYELFLKARYLLQHDTEEDDLEARRLFEQAIEKDPEFVDAYDGVLMVYVRSAGNGYAPPREAWTQTAEYARKTLEIDPGHFGARTALAARHFFYDWDWALAEREVRALSADPRSLKGSSYHGPAMYFWATGRPQESVSVMERGLRVDSQNMESRVMLADFLAESGRTGEAISHYKAIIAAESADARALFGLAHAQRRSGDIAGAIDTLRGAYELTGEQVGVDQLASAHTEKDYVDAELAVARDRLLQLEKLALERYVSSLDMARLQAKIGDRERAFATLETALSARDAGLVFLKVDRAWDPIRDDARFAAIVKRVGIP